MSFFGRARVSAAEEYGRARAERYGRVARMLRAVKVIFWFSVLVVVVLMWRLGQG